MDTYAGYDFTINGETGDTKTLAALIQVLNSAARLTATGGVLFKYQLHENIQHFGITPAVIEGQRSYHYNLKLPYEDQYCLIGDISATGIFRILFKPEEHPPTQPSIARYLGCYKSFASFLIQNGYHGTGSLDEVTRQLLAKPGFTENHPQDLYMLTEENG